MITPLPKIKPQNKIIVWDITKPNDWRLSTFVPFPGSYFWDHAKEYNIPIYHDFSKYHINDKKSKGGYITNPETINYREDLLNFLRKNIKNQYND